MRISRYCGKERLPGSARFWQRLARRAGFKGTLALYGYGVGGRPGGAQRKAERTGVQHGMVLADYEPGLIRVWVPARVRPRTSTPTSSGTIARTRCRASRT